MLCSRWCSLMCFIILTFQCIEKCWIKKKLEILLLLMEVRCLFWNTYAAYITNHMHNNFYAMTWCHESSINTGMYTHTHTSRQEHMHERSYSMIRSLQRQTFLLFTTLLVSIGNCYPGNRTDREKVSEWAEERGEKRLVIQTLILEFCLSKGINYK